CSSDLERDRRVARPLRANAQAIGRRELLHRRVVLDRRDAEAHLAVQVDAVVPELAVGPLLPAGPHPAEADPHAAVDAGGALDDDAGSRVAEPGALGQVLPGGAGLERVVGGRLRELLHLDALLAPG